MLQNCTLIPQGHFNQHGQFHTMTYVPLDDYKNCWHLISICCQRTVMLTAITPSHFAFENVDLSYLATNSTYSYCLGKATWLSIKYSGGVVNMTLLRSRVTP